MTTLSLKWLFSIMEVPVFPREVVPIRAMRGALLNSGILLVIGEANKSMYPIHNFIYDTYYFKVSDDIPDTSNLEGQEEAPLGKAPRILLN